MPGAMGAAPGMPGMPGMPGEPGMGGMGMGGYGYQQMMPTKIKANGTVTLAVTEQGH